MGWWDRLLGRVPLPPPEPETPAEIERRETRGALATLRRYGVHVIPASERRDALGSMAMGMGEATDDKRLTIAPVSRGYFGLEALDTLYQQGGLFRRLSAGPAVDAVSPGWRTDDGVSQDATSAFDRRHRLRAKLVDVTRFARAYGRAHLMIITDDGAPLDQPLPPGPHRIKALQVLMRRECIPVRWSSDLGAEGFGDVDLWQVVPIRVGVYAPATPVHASRVLTMRGLDPVLTPVPGFDLGRGLSVPDVYWDVVRDYLAATDAVAYAALEMSVPVLRMGAHAELMSGADRENALASLQLLKMKRSVFGTAVLAGADEYERVPVQFSGVRDAIAVLQERVCAIEGQPVTKVFGQAPGGLSTDNESGRVNYNTLLAGIRVDCVEPMIHAIYDTEFGPGDRTIQWGTVEPLSEREQAEIDEIRARRDEILIRTTAITAAESRARYEGDQVLPFPVVSAYDDIDDLDVGEPTEEEVREDAETYAVPEGARNNARRVLRWREEHGDEVRGMTEVGWRRARQLADNARVGYDTVAAMAAFNRHRKNAEVAEEHKGEPWRDAGHVAWLGWGGTTGIDWARKITGAAD